MDPLKAIYQCKEQVVQELKRIAIAKSPYPKRHKNERVPRPNITRFEDVLPRLQSKWKQSTMILFYNTKDQGVYDKLAYDLMNSFHKFYSKFNYDGEQLFKAFRCLLKPIIGQMMDENELGKKAYDRQEKRKHFFRKLLSYGIHETQQRNSVCHRQTTSSPDDPVDVCTTSQSETGGDDQLEDATTKLVKPTPISIIIIDLLVDALLRHNTSIARHENSGKERILHVMNINHVVDLVSKYFAEIKVKIEDDRTFGRVHDLDITLLSQSTERYETLLCNALEMLSVVHPLTVWRTQLDILLLQVTTIKPLLR